MGGGGWDTFHKAGRVTAPDPKNYLLPNDLRTACPMGTHNCRRAEELRQGDSKFKTCLGQSNSATSTSTNRAVRTVSKEEKSQTHGYSSSKP